MRTLTDIHSEHVPDAMSALRDVIELIDAGWLVRNTARDHEEGFGMRNLMPILKLTNAYRVAGIINNDAAWKTP